MTATQPLQVVDTYDIDLPADRLSSVDPTTVSRKIAISESALTGEFCIVHKEGVEGGLVLDISGRILTKEADRPAWSEGLLHAILGERTKFYESKVGPDYFAYHRQNTLEASDLEWLGVDAEGNECVFEADSEVRSANVNTFLEVIRVHVSPETGVVSGPGVTTIDSLEVDLDITRSDEDVKALLDARAAKFGNFETAPEADAKTGTR